MAVPEKPAMQETGVKKQSHVRHYLVVIACLMMCFGPSTFAFAATGIFYTPITQYLDVSLTTYAVTMTIESVAVIIVLPAVGRFLNKGDARLVLTLAVLCLAGSLLWRSFATELWHWYVTAAIMGVGVSITLYLATPTLIGRWFEDRVGFFVGLCMAFTGIGGVVFNAIGGNLIASGPEGWRMAYMVFAICCVVLTIPFILAIRSNPSDLGLLPYRSKKVKHEQKEVVLTGVTSKNALKLPIFWILCIFALFITFISVLLNWWPTYISTLSAVYPEVGVLIAWIASIAMVGAVIGKILLGAVSDINIRYGLIVGVVCGFLALGLFWFLPSSVIALAAGAFLFGIAYSMATVQLPMMCRYALGQLDYTTIYSRVSIASSIAGAAGAILWGTIVDGVGFSLLLPVAMVFLVICTVAGFWMISARKNVKFEEKVISSPGADTSPSEPLIEQEVSA